MLSFRQRFLNSLTAIWGALPHYETTLSLFPRHSLRCRRALATETRVEGTVSAPTTCGRRDARLGSLVAASVIATLSSRHTVIKRGLGLDQYREAHWSVNGTAM